DRNNDEDAALCAKRINEAYSILKNPDKKMAYDRKIGKTLESGFTHRRSKAIHADKLGQHPFISPEMRRRLPKLILASCTAVSCIVLLIMFLRNKLEIYTYQASALPEHYRQDTGQAYGTPGIGKGEPKETTIAGFQPAESQTQDTMTKTGALPEKSQKDRETEGLSVKAFNPPGTRTRSAGVTTLRISPSRAAQEKSMADAKSGIMEKPSREKTDDPSLNNMVRTASPDQNIQNIKKDISPASLQKKPSPEQVDVSGEITNPSPPVSVPKDNHPNLETEVFLFMSQYITAYEEGDITRFMDLFSKSAVENNRLQYADIMRFYQKNFEGGRYTYTLKNLRLQKGEDRVIVSGHYSIRKMTDNDTGLKKDGMIQWTLAKENGNFKIVKIDYDTK
ncbi:MAG TPA: nuclear transport factor 2 family protein, partial [Thermodesulfovibrionales bacterium]|nr:nuclear transport factor 2 family protein [Thermodesulfovibrionales bacterium]